MIRFPRTYSGGTNQAETGCRTPKQVAQLQAVLFNKGSFLPRVLVISEIQMSDSEFEDAYEDDKEIEHDGEDPLRSAILNTPISQLALRKPIMVDATTSVADAVHAMREQHFGCVLVQEADSLIGIFTERDVLNRVVFHNDQTVLIKSVMTTNPETLGSSESTAYALNMMCVGGYRHIPIVESHGRVIGILSVQDIVAFLVDLFPASILNLPMCPEMGIARGTDGG